MSKQFSVRFGYAMTISRGQGQLFDLVGVAPTIPMFSHGQFYVVASRRKNKNKLNISIGNDVVYVQDSLN